MPRGFEFIIVSIVLVDGIVLILWEVLKISHEELIVIILLWMMISAEGSMLLMRFKCEKKIGHLN
jgi:hypothetical protein